MSSGSYPLAVSQAEVQAADRRIYFSLVLLCVGHFFIDVYSSALAAFQPHLATKLGINLTEAGFLAGLYVFANSVTQPGFGYLSDRLHSQLFTTLAPAVAGLGIAMVGLAPNYSMVMLCAVVGGLGISSFHPQASARATQGIEQNKPFWMAVFICSGTLGLALGPTYFAFIVEHFGFEHSWYGAIPGVLVTLMLLLYLPGVGRAAGEQRKRFDVAPLKAVWKPLTILYFLVFIRSIVQVTFTQFLPLYLTRERGFSASAASQALSLYLGFGALGGFLGGNLANRFGGRTTILISMIGSVPFLAGFFFTRGWVSLVSLALGGLVLLFTIPVNVLMGQQLAPGQAGTVSALMMGFAWGMAGFVFIPLIGKVSDVTGLHNALLSLVLFPLLGFFLTLTYPKESRR
ncbi:MAG: MFS transporter [Acidobacteria bacterium]|nr:MFS transporter [Acidobacteriota bacterium]